jgi:hypothetical protein
MVELIGATIGTALDNPRTTDQLVTKRLCVRPPSGLGERTDRTHEYGGEKGMSTKQMYDLDSGGYDIRNKANIIERELDLGLALRAIDRARWMYVA